MLVCIDRQFVQLCTAGTNRASCLRMVSPTKIVVRIIAYSLTVSMVVIFAVWGSDCWSSSIMANRLASLLMLVSSCIN